jgi:hypothetical protein
MKRLAFLGVTLAAAWLVAVRGSAQDVPSFSLGFRNAPCGEEVVGPPGGTYSATWDVTLTTSDNPSATAGAQGWSISLAAEGGLRIVSATTNGTAAATAERGGRQKSGFEIAEPDPNNPPNPKKMTPGAAERVDCPGGLQGAVSAAVLSFTLPVTLPASGTEVVLKLGVEGTFPQEPGDCVSGRVFFTDGCVGSGQPVNNVVTYMGDSVLPEHASCPVTLCAAPVPCEELESFIVVHGQSAAIATGRHQAIGSLFSSATNAVQVNVAEGAEARTQVFFAITSKLPGGGLQGWSLSASITGEVTPEVEGTPANEEKDPPIPAMPTGTTIDGTAAAEFPDGLRKSGFAVVQRIDPTKIHPTTGEPQGKGVVSAVVLSFTLPITLAPVGTATVLGIELIADRQPSAGAPVSGVVRWRDDLTGEGQPVKNVATVGGDTEQFCECRPLSVVFRVGDGAQAFIRGDSNNDGKHNIADAIWTVNTLFRGGPPSPCQNAADANDDGAENLSDVSYTIMHQFMGGAAPPAPYPNCGQDPTAPTKLACPEGSVPHCP